MTRPFLTLHALQPMPPSLLNRDSTGASKTVVYGGTSRIRVSSQSWKRAIRGVIRDMQIDGGAYALRTPRLPALTAEALAVNHGRDIVAATARAAGIYSALNLAANEKTGNTKVTLFVNEGQPVRTAEIINEHWDDIAVDVDKKGAATLVIPDQKADPEGFARVSAVIDAAAAEFDPGYAIDIALQGRMLAERPNGQVVAAMHADHAHSVDPAAITPDFFTVVDDAAEPGGQQTVMIGESELSAPTFYRSVSLDRRQLLRNLSSASDPEALAAAATEALITAFVRAVPVGKQSSTNAATVPSVVLGIETDQPLSLSNAFVTPIVSDVVATATRRLGQVAQGYTRVADSAITSLVIDQSLAAPLAAELPAAVEAGTLAEFIGAVNGSRVLA